MELWVWGAVVIIALVVEFSTTDLLSIWFAFGGIAAFIFAAFGLPLWSQMVVFVGVAALLLVFTRKFFKKLLRGSEVLETNVNAMIGLKTELLETIDELHTGSVKVNGVVWSARSAVGEDIEAGSFVEVVEVSGNKLLVKKIVNK